MSLFPPKEEEEEEEEEDYSPSATVTTFPQPLSLLRIPTPTSTSLTLAYKSPQSFTNSYKSSLSRLLSDCHSAARLSSSLTASRRCQPPWWRLFSVDEFAERGRCEEREAEACFEAAKGKCREFVRERCWKGFRNAWVRVGGGVRGTELRRGSDLVRLYGFPDEV